MLKIGQKIFIIHKSKIISGYVKIVGVSSTGPYCRISAGCEVPSVIKISDVFKSRVEAKLAKYKQDLESLNNIIKNRENERDGLVRKIANIEKSIKR